MGICCEPCSRAKQWRCEKHCGVRNKGICKMKEKIHMRNSLSPERTAKILGVLVCGVVVLLGLAVPVGTVSAQSDLPMFYSVLGPDGIVARVITDQANC